MRRSILQLIVLALASPVLLVASTASATPSLASCGNINVTASASCTVVTSGGCKAQCVPINFTAACDGKCTGAIDAGCSGTCKGSCSAECTANPGTFDCEGTCTSDCSGDCTASCSSKSNAADCEAYCKGDCSTSCKGKCSGTPPSATCDARCEAKCSGECYVKSNLDCSLSCSADLTGGCTVQCDEPKGALFCDGQYVDTGNNLDDCVSYLQSTLNIKVSGYASCSGDSCKAGGTISCAVADVTQSPPWSAGAVGGAVVGLGLLVGRRRRR